MGLNDTPKGERIHIGIFGRRNAGKSSIINAITNQNLAIVSDVKGTTTDPVSKAMELFPLGPVVIIDTPGLDDVGSLGEKRIEKAYQVLNKTDIALLILDAEYGLTDVDKELLKLIKEKNIPYIILMNKSDILSDDKKNNEFIYVSTKTGENIKELKELIAKKAPKGNEKVIVSDLINKGDKVILVIPIDKAAPKGRLILPQQQTIRDILDKGAVSIMCKEDELKNTINSLKEKPSLVITDSQAFKSVDKDTPKDIPLTSFSILFARFKGEIDVLIDGVRKIKDLDNSDTILISEGCTHHRQCGDIGSEKIPKWLKDFTGKDLKFEFSSGTEFPRDLSKYALVVHCGGCMLNEKEMKHRIKYAVDNGVNIVNYGILIAYLNGILERAVEPLGIKL
ncbi:[FeFe] hydrogenase H-cluster maturation GTPase HydF [Anaerofustis stercorihominis]|uniref:[FeFe] hydrogenase H-cluster maturation GTPase HydF n=1 Tax=Anaerofustis stercorihominis TaxID=214853 RepID=A0A3E3DYT9_9FIRM|nr:[FeFe] hydrogenase H-cluster maturation GTPase HydF [Anaerofustis stercorihominis]MCQ4794718.1 [FeFe] hydrogenase H-cluster maturation GTPase HydF [Anaerofustis stercorihominis]RGD73868.1 [FeFe] hydrogenase H-cluster maturation GTPase HydF [Anaerofustis stercorihominis]